MAGKSLSTGTLSLRFMQNAHRAKQLAQVEAEQAHVKDEAEWEVAKEVREAWGVGVETSGARQSVSYEASYIPFLFDRETVKPKGRRTFNKRGHEVEESEQSAEDRPQGQPNGNPTNNSSTARIRPISISGSSSAVHKIPVKDARKIKDPSKTAKQTIRDTSGVGTDLRTASSSVRSPPQPSSLGSAFLKPSGVDEPAASPHVPTIGPQDDKVVSGAKSKGKKREREAASEPTDEEKKAKKRKKKKKKTGVE